MPDASFPAPERTRPATERAPAAVRRGPAAAARPSAPPGPDLRARILERLGPSPLAEDQLIRDLGEGAAVLAPALTDLELEGVVVRQPGGLLALAA